MKNLDEKNMDTIISHLYVAECALEGLFRLMRESQGSLDGDEMNGVGEMAMLIRNEVLKVKQVLHNPALISQLENFSPKIGFQKVRNKKE